MTYIFESGLAHHIEGLIQQKRADGYAYHAEEKLLKRFDTSHTSHTKIRHTTRNYATLGIWKRFFQFSGSLLIKRDTSSAIWHSDAL